MAEDVATMAAALSAGTRGSDNPDRMVVKRPALEALKGLCGFGAAAFAVVVLVIGILTWAKWDATTQGQRINFIGGLGVCSAFGAILAIAAFAMPTIGRVEASAGPGHIELGGREERS